MIFFCILFFISFILESLSTNLFKEFMPFFILGVITIISVSKLSKNRIIILLFIVGILYDLSYTNFIFLHGVIYVLLFYFASFILKGKNNFFAMIFTYYLMVFIYSLVMIFYSTIIFNVNIIKLITIIGKSLLVNSIYFILLYITFIGIKCLTKNIKLKRTY